MSMGGDFYAMSNKQLEDVLAQEVDWSAFLYGELDEKPRDVYSELNWHWYAMSRIFSAEGLHGSEFAEHIPEITSYAFAHEAGDHIDVLNNLSEDELKQRFDGLDEEERGGLTFDELMTYFNSLKEFFKRVNENQNAILFRVT